MALTDNIKDPDFTQISEKILYFPGHANITVLNLDSNSLMIDCGRNINEAKAIKRITGDIFGNDIRYVALTHFHNDHTHSLPCFSDCDIIASARVRKFLRSAKRKRIKECTADWQQIPNITFTADYVLKEAGYQILCKQTGGHTPDSCYVYSSGHKVLVAGDNLRSDFLWGGRNCNPDHWISALKEFATLDADYIIIGHGEILTTENVKAVLDLTVEVKRRTESLLSQNVSDPEIIADVSKMKTPDKYGIFIHADTVPKWLKFWKNRI
ncbi:MAG: MBL fold metallo-hydrolase [Candidatus Heimdallarchaeota archaeon]